MHGELVDQVEDFVEVAAGSGSAEAVAAAPERGLYGDQLKPAADAFGVDA